MRSAPHLSTFPSLILSRRIACSAGEIEDDIDCMMTFLTDQEVDQTIVDLNEVSCVASVIGSSLLLCALLCAMQGRSKHAGTHQEMLVWLSLSDFVTAVAYLLPTRDLTSAAFLCKLQALVATVSACCAFMWTNAIALDLWRTVYFRNQTMDTRGFLVRCRLACFGLPLLITVALAASGMAGKDAKVVDSFCWIRGTNPDSSNTTATSDSPKETFWRMESGKTLEWFSFVFVVACYASALAHVRRIELPQSMLTSISVRMMAIPVVFVLCRIPSTVITIQTLSGAVESPYDSWKYLQAALDPAQGFANCMVYLACHSQTHKHPRRWCRRVLGLAPAECDESSAECDGSLAQERTELLPPSECECTTEQEQESDLEY